MVNLLFRLGRVIIYSICFLLSNIILNAQARLVLNGAFIQIINGGNLVIANPATNAITRNSGAIFSDAEYNNVQWNIGTTAGTYVIPFGYGAANYIPLTFTTSGAVGAGNFVFSTLHTNSQNSLNLPSGVTNFNGASGADKSYFAVDRFWKINAQGYTTKPTLTNLIFTYVNTDFAAPDIISLESGLSAQRYNSGTNSWNDYAKAAIVNTVSKTVKVTSLAPADLYQWWALDYVEDRHWVGASNGNWSNIANWALTNGGTSGASVPSTYDAVSFNSTSNTNATIDVNPTIGSFTMNAGYTGTVTQGASIINLSKTTNFSGGTFTGGSGAITVTGPFTLSGTNFTSTTGILDLKDNFTNNSGSFIHNNGTVSFSGTTAAQTISGTQVTNFNNINVSNVFASPGLLVQSNQNLIGNLKLSANVVVDADGSSNNSVFTLLSSAEYPVKDASVDVLPAGAQVIGNVTVQRYMALNGRNSHRIYRYISSPIQSTTVANIQNKVPVTGSFTGSSACYGCSSSPSLYNYDETVITDLNGDGFINLEDGYRGYPTVSNSQSLVVGKGYAMFVRGNLFGGNTLWDVIGVINAGNVSAITLPVSFTSSGTVANDGWNLVGNPFPSSIDWNSASGWTKSANIGGSIYVTDNGTGGALIHTSYNGSVGTNGGSRYIPAFQGFWVKATAAGATTLTVNENVKAPQQSTSFFREAEPTDVLRITLSDSVFKDEAVVHFREDATSGFDNHADAWKFKNSYVNISTLTADSLKLSINSLPSLVCNAKVNLALDEVKTGSYSMKFSNLSSFIDSPTFILKDSLLNKSININDNSEYSFNVTSDPKSYGSKRFSLQVNKDPVPITITEAAGVLSVNYTKNVQWYINGQLIKGAIQAGFTPTRSGTYSATVKTGDCFLSGSKDYMLLNTEPTNNFGLEVFPNPSTGKFSINIPASYKIQSVTIINPQGVSIGTVDVKEYNGTFKGEYDLGNYSSGVYIIKVIHDQGINYLKVVKN